MKSYWKILILKKFEQSDFIEIDNAILEGCFNKTDFIFKNQNVSISLLKLVAFI